MDWLHPLAEPQFERMNSVSPPSSVSHLKTPIVWKDAVYALGRDHGGEGKLYKYSLSTNEWNEFPVPSSIYTPHSELTTYCSKLMLISGENMNIWEFENNCFTFKESCIGPVPLCEAGLLRFTAVSKANHLATIHIGGLSVFTRYNNVQYTFNGKSWENKTLLSHRFFGSGVYFRTVIDDHTILLIKFSRFSGEIKELYKAPLILCEDHNIINDSVWERLEVMSLEEVSDVSLNSLPNVAHCTLLLHNNLLYLVDKDGDIFTSFIQSFVPVIWGHCGFSFEQAPQLVVLQDGTMLMVGIIKNHCGSEVDVIKISFKGKLLFLEGIHVGLVD